MIRDLPLCSRPFGTRVFSGTSIPKPVESEADANEHPTEINIRVVWEFANTADSEIIEPGVADRHSMKACSGGEIKHFPFGPE